MASERLMSLSAAYALIARRYSSGAEKLMSFRSEGMVMSLEYLRS